jgi:nucleotide-binding universal stress UspA family protein
MGEHVLAPVDGSDYSEKAFEYILESIEPSTLTIVHVINPVNVWEYGDEEAFDFESYQREQDRQQRRAEELLASLAERAESAGFETKTVLTAGKPSRRILEVADEEGVDHIVMGSRGRSGVGRVLFGSVAESVSRRASVPVTIVR